MTKNFEKLDFGGSKHSRFLFQTRRLAVVPGACLVCEMKRAEARTPDASWRAWLGVDAVNFPAAHARLHAASPANAEWGGGGMLSRVGLLR